MKFQGFLSRTSRFVLCLTASYALPLYGAPQTQPVPVPRGALDRSLVNARGANAPFVEQEAEKPVTDGTIIGPARTAYTLPAEASGRAAVKLLPGQYVEFTLPEAANAITVRYSIPDSPTGGGITAPLDVSVNGRSLVTMTLTSQYAWLYNQYPFSNDPNAGLLFPDQYITECACVPSATTPPPIITKPFRPNHFYDEQRLLLHHRYQPGDKIRLTAPASSNAAWTVIDLLDSELAGPAQHPNEPSVTVQQFAADPIGQRDSADAFDAAIASAKAWHRVVYLPPGTYQVNRHILVDNVTIEGAGTWDTIVKGHQGTLSPPFPDGSVHTGVGFYVKHVADRGSSNVHLSGLAIKRHVREPCDGC